MPISPELAELYNERDFLKEKLGSDPLSLAHDELWHRIDRLNVAIQIRRETSTSRKEVVYVIATSQKEARAISICPALKGSVNHASYKVARETLAHLRSSDFPKRDATQTEIWSKFIVKYKVWRVEIRRPLTKQETEAKYFENKLLTPCPII